jgi:hypothetical protein
MRKSFVLAACAILAGCTGRATKPPAAPATAGDTPIGTIVRGYAIERSHQECQAKNLSAEECQQKLDAAQQHLDSVNARIEALLKDPRTNKCDMVKFIGACVDPVNTLGDLADCLQVTPDRGEAINSGRVAFNLDSRGCPTSNKPIPIPAELTGVWSTKDAEFAGDVLSKGQALYLDSDGIGALVSASGANAVTVRVSVNMFDVTYGSLSLDFTKNGKVFANDLLMRDRRDPHAWISNKSAAVFHRRSDTVSSDTRHALGLEPRRQ